MSNSLLVWSQLHLKSTGMAYRRAVQALMERGPVVNQPATGTDDVQDDEARFSRRVKFFSDVCPAKLRGVEYFHVAGSKGKGSVCELLRVGLSANGRKVGTFTSPHIHTVRERIRVGKSLISEAALVDVTSRLADTFAQHPWLLFFDKLLAVALIHFAEEGVDYMVLEVGIGGKFDSTNFMPRAAAATIITSISYDHQDLLGDTLELIAEQKAGIVKDGSLAFCSSSQEESVLRVIQATVESRAGELVLVEPHEHAVDPDDKLLSWVEGENLLLVKAVMTRLRLCDTSFETCFWPCRFEVFEIPGGDSSACTVVLDGAHNADSMHKLLRRAQSRFPETHLRVVFGAAADKNLSAMLSAVSNFAASILLVRAADPRAATTETLQRFLPGASDGTGGLEVALCEENMSVERGMEVMRSNCTSHASTVVLVCGSLYVCAQARQWLAGQYPDLFRSGDWVHERDLL